MEEVKDYGKFIARHRLASGYKSQRQFAEATGISAATISRIEDEKHRPAPETIQAFAKRLHTTSLVELMVVCGYWNEDELLTPIEIEKDMMEIKKRNSPSKEELLKLSEISIEDLVKHNLTYKGHTLTEDQKQQLVKILQAAAEMLENKKQ